ncbi:hypothetical protein HDC95_002366 [Microbacterium sp. AK031]|nr:hypothetical protein [Microbacterium sp. AK031]
MGGRRGSRSPLCLSRIHHTRAGSSRNSAVEPSSWGRGPPGTLVERGPPGTLVESERCGWISMDAPRGREDSATIPMRTNPTWSTRPIAKSARPFPLTTAERLSSKQIVSCISTRRAPSWIHDTALFVRTAASTTPPLTRRVASWSARSRVMATPGSRSSFGSRLTGACDCFAQASPFRMGLPWDRDFVRRQMKSPPPGFELGGGESDEPSDEWTFVMPGDPGDDAPSVQGVEWTSLRGVRDAHTLPRTWRGKS